MNYGSTASHIKVLAMGKKKNNSHLQKSDLKILRESFSTKYDMYLKVQKKTKPLDSYFFVEEKKKNDKQDSFLVVSDKYESDYLSFLFNSSIGKEQLFGEKFNPYIDNDIKDSSIEKFKVIDVSKKRQDKYGLLEREIQSLIEQDEISPLLDKLVDLRDALALELYDRSFFEKHDIDLFEKLEECFEDKEPERMLGHIEDELSDLADMIDYVNLVSDDVIKKILKEIRK